MKILTGSLRGQTIAFKPNRHLRPTADKTRKAIFDMLQGSLDGARVLDLFSGTGALGFEALSNGAESVTFVEIEKTQDLTIEKNLAKLGLYEKGEVIVSDAIKAIERFSEERRKFDFIFMDPPYEKGFGEKALAALKKADILNKNALIVFECRESEVLVSISAFECIKDKTYGDSRVLIYKHD
jgi:16S rRNA (guanine966-N2)-methyltransferase